MEAGRAIGLGASNLSHHVQESFPLQGLFSDKLKNSKECSEQLDHPHHSDMSRLTPFKQNVVISYHRSGAPNSSEAINEEGQGKIAGGEDEERSEQREQKKSKLKPKKCNQKKLKQPRFAFMTRSEVDHLEDGYRWRKYGQKAVKNSPFPRSYYHCTTVSCNVKKRVERCCTDPAIVITTYEGQHSHGSPLKFRPNYFGIPFSHGYNSVASFGAFGQVPEPNLFDLSSFGYQSNHVSAPVSEETSFKDDGLLQDLVQPHMYKKQL